jgi:phosphatidylserine/phosphatidylglycerophosphate/cardiolipin synthase-like enzyme
MSSNRTTSAELVITTPEPYGAYFAERIECRVTIGVLTQLIAQAKRRIIISAPYLQEGFGLSSGPIADALQTGLKNGINVGILSTGSSLRTIDRRILENKSNGKLVLYQPAANLADSKQIGSHAKFCVVDGERAYIGSANLTGPGLSKHLEIGVLVSGEIAKKMEELWYYSIEIGLFVKEF